MTIDWQHFTPYSALAGGAIIGAAVALLLLFNGRIAGISGITGGLLSAVAASGLARRISWRVADFLLYAAAAACRLLRSRRQRRAGGSRAVGGVGTRLGSGCTSGHGVCGVARLAPRSLAPRRCRRCWVYDRVADAPPAGRVRCLNPCWRC
ncbi:YeeE/YedE family protein [Serratia ureilytica]